MSGSYLEPQDQSRDTGLINYFDVLEYISHRLAGQFVLGPDVVPDPGFY